jgi:hypothetical protein
MTAARAQALSRARVPRPRFSSPTSPPSCLSSSAMLLVTTLWLKKRPWPSRRWSGATETAHLPPWARGARRTWCLEQICVTASQMSRRCLLR